MIKLYNYTRRNETKREEMKAASTREMTVSQMVSNILITYNTEKITSM